MPSICTPHPPHRLKRRIEKIEPQQRATAPKYSLEFDEDSLAIDEIQYYLHGTDTEHSVIAALPIGIRSKEVHDLVYGPTIPMHEIERWPRCTLASCEFEHAFDREPKPGDLLRWEHVFAVRGSKVNAFKFKELISTWKRRIPELPCPLKFEDGRLFKRRRGGAWTEDFTVGCEAHWWNVECEARGARDHSAPIWQPDLLATMPSILGVTFTGLMNGKHACRPATDEELKRPETDEFFRAVLCAKPTTAPPPGNVWIRHCWTGFYYDVSEASVAAETEGPGAVHERPRATILKTIQETLG